MYYQVEELVSPPPPPSGAAKKEKKGAPRNLKGGKDNHK